MSTLQPSVPTERLVCEICLGEVPQSAVLVPEVADYVAHFCGLPCYELLKKLPELRQIAAYGRP
ncbi:DUF3330 domain-containing protein [Variovorax sp. LjRoot290]|uniref:DUF3330 domain-containing protein n=1 Tax=Variovorax sp. LjRoot290 TaxID=3342316 RepID=UPI003F51AB88